MKLFYKMKSVIFTPPPAAPLNLVMFFSRFSQNCEKRLLASSCLSVCLSFRPSFRPSVRMEQLGSTEPIFIKFNIWGFFFSKICSENPMFIKIWHERRDLYMKTTVDILTISRSILPRMRNVSDESCTENQNTHFVFNNLHHHSPSRKSCLSWDIAKKKT